MASSAAAAAGIEHPENPSRRDFLYIATAAMGAVGAMAALVPLIDQMNPDASTLAAGGPVDLDVSKIEEGAQVVIYWRQRPIFVFHRGKQTLDALQSAQDVALLADPDSKQVQQAPYAANWHRSIKPEYSVLVGICTHLGCIPLFYPIAERDRAGAELAGRLFLSLPWLQIRCRRQGLFRRAGAVQSAGAALSLRQRHDDPGRREPDRLGVEFRFHPPALDSITPTARSARACPAASRATGRSRARVRRARGR